jgi:hypothetical protein
MPLSGGKETMQSVGKSMALSCRAIRRLIRDIRALSPTPCLPSQAISYVPRESAQEQQATAATTGARDTAGSRIGLYVVMCVVGKWGHKSCDCEADGYSDAVEGRAVWGRLSQLCFRVAQSRRAPKGRRHIVCGK